MNIEQLQSELSSHDPDRDAVLRRLHTKQRARRHRMIGGLTAVILAAGAATWLTVGHLRPSGSPTTPTAAASAAAPPVTGVMGPQAPGGSETPDAAVAAGESCLPLKERLTNAVSNGFSVIVGRGVLTGRTGVDGYDHREMRLTAVRTLAGPRVDEGATAWVRAPQRAADPGAVQQSGPDGPLWGPDGALFGIYVPRSLAKGPLGTTVYHLPVVGDNVVLAKSGCWNYFGIGDLPGAAFHGPLTELPGSGTYTQMVASGLVTVPLSRIEALLPR